MEHGRYDVILTDLELGEGKMEGIEFVDRAFDVQQSRGIRPIISVFSYNDDLLRKAENEFGTGSQGRPRKVFHHVNLNRKTRFKAIDFRREVSSFIRWLHN